MKDPNVISLDKCCEVVVSVITVPVWGKRVQKVLRQCVVVSGPQFLGHCLLLGSITREMLRHKEIKAQPWSLERKKSVLLTKWFYLEKRSLKAIECWPSRLGRITWRQMPRFPQIFLHCQAQEKGAACLPQWQPEYSIEEKQPLEPRVPDPRNPLPHCLWRLAGGRQ